MHLYIYIFSVFCTFVLKHLLLFGYVIADINIFDPVLFDIFIYFNRMGFLLQKVLNILWIKSKSINGT